MGAQDTGHPCDSSTAVLYPYATPGVPLSAEVLDFNHDDYYGHSGAWNDMQDSVFLHHTDAAAVARAMDAGACGFVRKQDAYPTVLTAIRSVLRGGIYPPSGASVRPGPER